MSIGCVLIGSLNSLMADKIKTLKGLGLEFDKDVAAFKVGIGAYSFANGYIFTVANRGGLFLKEEDESDSVIVEATKYLEADFDFDKKVSAFMSAIQIPELAAFAVLLERDIKSQYYEGEKHAFNQLARGETAIREDVHVDLISRNQKILDFKEKYVDFIDSVLEEFKKEEVRKDEDANEEASEDDNVSEDDNENEDKEIKPAATKVEKAAKAAEEKVVLKKSVKKEADKKDSSSEKSSKKAKTAKVEVEVEAEVEAVEVETEL